MPMFCAQKLTLARCAFAFMYLIQSSVLGRNPDTCGSCTFSGNLKVGHDRNALMAACSTALTLFGGCGGGGGGSVSFTQVMLAVLPQRSRLSGFASSIKMLGTDAA